MLVEVDKKQYRVIRFTGEEKFLQYGFFPYRQYMITGMYYFAPFRYTPAPPLKGKKYRPHDGKPRSVQPVHMDITDKVIYVGGVKFCLSHLKDQDRLQKYLADIAAIDRL